MADHFGGMRPRTGCHAYEAIRPMALPPTWRRLHATCGYCGDGMILILADLQLRLCLRCDASWIKFG